MTLALIGLDGVFTAEGLETAGFAVTGFVAAGLTVAGFAATVLTVLGFGAGLETAGFGTSLFSFIGDFGSITFSGVG
ncbi:hypothetical protein [Flavobacterium marginilacus]|uniref:hypothetical protein n=1 Tax=Flavobacterium marginilacus TaxID=3003256 RepID=UPI00248F1D44|nr:hypothetical protein [Flavobacterium marginilacus]